LPKFSDKFYLSEGAAMQKQRYSFDLPEYQNIHVDLELSFWANKPTVWVNGQLISPSPKNPREFMLPLPNRTEVKMEIKGFTFDYQPRVIIGGKFISVARKLKWYETLLASIPVVLLFTGGALGGLCAFVAVSSSFKTLRSESDKFLRLFLVLLITAGAFLGYMMIRTIIHWIFRI